MSSRAASGAGHWREQFIAARYSANSARSRPQLPPAARCAAVPRRSARSSIERAWVQPADASPVLVEPRPRELAGRGEQAVLPVASPSVWTSAVRTRRSRSASALGVRCQSSASPGETTRRRPPAGRRSTPGRRKAGSSCASKDSSCPPVMESPRSPAVARIRCLGSAPASSRASGSPSVVRQMLATAVAFRRSRRSPAGRRPGSWRTAARQENGRVRSATRGLPQERAECAARGHLGYSSGSRGGHEGGGHAPVRGAPGKRPPARR